LGVAGGRAGAVALARDLDPRARGALAEARERGVDDVAEPQWRELGLLLAREAQEMRDRALDALELGERHARVLDVLRAARVLLHLLHQALRGGDRVADLVRDRRRELLERARVAGLQRPAPPVERRPHPAA